MRPPLPLLLAETDMGLPPNYTAMVAIGLAIFLWVGAGYLMARPSNTRYK